MKIRLDKYVWCVRLTKTRSLATDLISKSKILLNDQVIKPSREVKIGDLIVVQKHSARFECKVLDLIDRRLGAPLVKDFILDQTKEEEIQKLKVYQEAQRNYRLTDGKPTKKDRRELDRLLDDWSETN
jgi:ribosome-associated heat shock protein Hsp15